MKDLGRFPGFVVLVPGSWLVWEAIQPPIVSALVEVTGGSPEAPGGPLTIHRYLVIGVCRTVWWLAVALLAARVVRYRPVELVWKRRRSLIALSRGMLAGSAMIAVVICAIVAAGAGRLAAPTGNPMQWTTIGVVWLLAELLIAAGEELLFRITLFAIARHLIGTWPAAIVSALLFAAAHRVSAGEPLFMVQLTAMGLILVISLRRSDAIWWPIGIHAGWNWTCATLFGAVDSGVANDGQIFRFQPLGPRLLDGGSIGPEASVLTVAGLIVLLLWYGSREMVLRRTDRHG